MNYQNCGHMTFYPTYSFEQFYKGVRRCWRFGRTDPVIVDVIASPGEEHVINGLDKKMSQAERMFASLIKHMKDSQSLFSEDGHDKELILPDWLPRPLRAKTALSNLALEPGPAYANTLTLCRQPLRRGPHIHGVVPHHPVRIRLVEVWIDANRKRCRKPDQILSPGKRPQISA